MNPELTDFSHEHLHLTRRFFLSRGAAGIAALSVLPKSSFAEQRPAALQKVVDGIEEE